VGVLIFGRNETEIFYGGVFISTDPATNPILGHIQSSTGAVDWQIKSNIYFYGSSDGWHF
jgi:hypothetical protein